MLSSDDPHTVFVASNDQYLQPNDDKSANAPKKKSMERISKLFQKKAKKQSASPSLTPSFSTVSLSSSNYEPQAVSSTFNSSKSKRSSSLRMPFKGDSTERRQNDVGDSFVTPEIRTSLDNSPYMPRKDASKDDMSSSIRTGGKEDPGQGSINGAAGDTGGNKRSMSTRSTASSAAGGKGACATAVAPLKAQLERRKRLLENLQVEQQQYQSDNKILSERLETLKAKQEQRQTDMKQLQDNFDQHLRSLRATNDDLDSVGEKIKSLKENINELASVLVERGDAEAATKALSTFWLNLNSAIEEMGCPLPKHRLQMLTEKFMMDVLVQNLNLNVFPGVEIVDAYNQLQYWLEDNISDQNAAFPVRLRQEVALMVFKKETDKESDVYRSRHSALQNNWKYLYSGIVKAYPFVYQHDKAEPDVRKHYGAKVQLLVDQAINLGLAIKGQELDVTAAAVTEGEQVFDPELMVDEDGQTSGTVCFCICPPFVVGNPAPIKTLLKGRVLCNPSPKSAPK